MNAATPDQSSHGPDRLTPRVANSHQTSHLAGIHLVMVQPMGPINVGAAARIMANFGMHRLTLVNPRCTITDGHAIAFSSHGRPVLEAARIVPDLRAALAPCAQSFALSSRLGLYRRQAAIVPEVAADAALRFLHSGGEVAVVLGPEDHGLTLDDLLLVDRIVTIPAAESYPVLNVAAAATVMCYELFRSALRWAERPALPMAIEHPPATDQQKQRFFERLFSALEKIGFFFHPDPTKLQHALRHALGRLDLNETEADILLGMAKQMHWFADRAGPIHPRAADTADQQNRAADSTSPTTPD